MRFEGYPLAMQAQRFTDQMVDCGPYHCLMSPHGRDPVHIDDTLEEAVVKVTTNKWRIAIAIIVPVMALSACSSSSDSGSNAGDKQASSGKLSTTSVDSKDVCKAGREGGTLNYRANPEGAGLDPAVSQANQNATGAIYGTLLKWDGTAKAFVGDVAESITGNSDSTVWTLKLRDDVKFPDGSVLDAAAVKTNVERYLDPDFASAFTSRVAEIKSMKVEGPQTLTFTLSSPWGTFPWLFTQNVGMIVNPAVLKSTPAKELAVAPPTDAGVGAFALAKYDQGVSMTFKGKSNWWGGPVCLDELNLSFGTNDSVADLEATQTGQVDGFATYDTQALTRAAKDKKFHLFTLPGALASPFLLNTTKPPFNDVRMRQALSYALDRKLINDRIYGGLAVASGSIVSPDFGYKTSVKALEFDEAKAKSLIKEAIGDGVSTKFGYTVNKTPSNENLAILQQALAKKAGLDMNLDLLQQPDWIEKVFATHNFDSAQGGISSDESCPYCGLDQVGSQSPTNVGSFKSAKVDAALAQLKATPPGDGMSAAIDNMQKVWNEEMPVVVAIWLPQIAVLDKKVHGLQFSTSAYQVHFDKVYVAK